MEKIVTKFADMDVIIEVGPGNLLSDLVKQYIQIKRYYLLAKVRLEEIKILYFLCSNVIEPKTDIQQVSS